MNSIFRVWGVAGLALMLLLNVGCGSTNYQPAASANPEEARQALKSALDAWKAGTAQADLANQTPKLYVGDTDWKEGNKLSGYEVVGSGELIGNNVRFQVNLDVKPTSGSANKKMMAYYLVATDPVQSVRRDDRVD